MQLDKDGNLNIGSRLELSGLEHRGQRRYRRALLVKYR